MEHEEIFALMMDALDGELAEDRQAGSGVSPTRVS